MLTNSDSEENWIHKESEVEFETQQHQGKCSWNKNRQNNNQLSKGSKF